MKLKNKFKIALLVIAVLSITASCEEAEEVTNGPVGQIELKFDNAVGSINAGSLVSEAGSNNYNFKNSKNGQQYNISVLRYFISDVKFEGPNGLVYKEEMAVSATDAKGIYLVDESDISSLSVLIKNIPVGEYNKLTFKVGIDSGIVAQGAAGGVLSQGGGPKDTDMFWNWNNGYLTFKMEGNAADSKGMAVGETIKEDDANGYSFHVGGWSSTMNNNKVVELTIDKVDVVKTSQPEVHIVMDVNEVMTNQTVIDFTEVNNIHSPASGVAVANNLQAAFKFDHIH